MLPSLLEPGDRLGKYEIQSHIASGGMGEVYKAREVDLNRVVALKVVSPHLSGRSVILDRFRREARSAARLSHQHIVTLFEFGHDAAHDLHYLAMEFIDGVNLEDYLFKRSRLHPEEARLILIQAAKALEHAFSMGVIHRDIKPSNLMLAKQGGKTVVKLTDLGLAIAEDDDEFKLTREGNTVGTIDYMAPEQARDSRAADIRSDLYSLGCTAFHLLAGRAPFAEGAIGARVHKHQNTPPPDLRSLNPTVSPDFQAIIEKLLAKKPVDRYQDPRELIVALKALRAEAAVELATEEELEEEPKPNLDHVRASGLHERAVQVIEEGKGGDYAKQLLQQCLEIEPFNTTYRRTLRELNRKAAEGNLRRWLGSLGTLDFKTKLRKARSSSEWKKVLEHGEEVLAHQPGDVSTNLEMVEAAEQLDQPDLARWILEQALHEAPGQIPLLKAAAEFHERRQEWKSALALWKDVTVADPNDVFAHRKIKDLLAQAHLAKVHGKS